MLVGGGQEVSTTVCVYNVQIVDNDKHVIPIDCVACVDELDGRKDKEWFNRNGRKETKVFHENRMRSCRLAPTIYRPSAMTYETTRPSYPYRQRSPPPSEADSCYGAETILVKSRFLCASRVA